MATLSAIREGLRANLASLDLGGYSALQVSAYGLSNPTPPCVQVIGPDEITYDRAMQRGHDDWVILVQAFTGLVTDRGAQELLDRLLESSGSSSVKAAIESDRTLGGAAQFCRVERASGYRQYASAQGDVLGCEWFVAVIA